MAPDKLATLLVVGSRGAVSPPDRAGGKRVNGSSKEVAHLPAQVRLAEAAVWDFDPALEFLAELEVKGAISRNDLEERLTVDLALAIGMLAAAHLCDADSSAIRITPRGTDFLHS